MRPTLLLPRLLAALAALLALPALATSRAPRPPSRAASSFRPQRLSLFVRPYNYLKFRENPPPKGRKLQVEPREFTNGDYPWREPQGFSRKRTKPDLRVDLSTGKCNHLLFDLDKFRSVRPRRGKFEEDAGRGKRARPRDRDMN